MKPGQVTIWESGRYWKAVLVLAFAGFSAPLVLAHQAGYSVGLLLSLGYLLLFSPLALLVTMRSRVTIDAEGMVCIEFSQLFGTWRWVGNESEIERLYVETYAPGKGDEIQTSIFLKGTGGVDLTPLAGDSASLARTLAEALSKPVEEKNVSEFATWLSLKDICAFFPLWSRSPRTQT
jgi:hypothetical protein